MATTTDPKTLTQESPTIARSIEPSLKKKERSKLQPRKKTLSSEYLEETHMKTILRLDEKGLLKVHQTATTPYNG